MAFLLFALAFIILVIGAPALFVPSKFIKVVGGMVKNPDLVRLFSLWQLLVAFFFLAVYPLFTGGWLVLISLLGWIMLIKSVVGLWFPVWIMKKSQMFLQSKTMTMVVGGISIIFVLFLLWVGMVKF
jgi:hypothetical protein